MSKKKALPRSGAPTYPLVWLKQHVQGNLSPRPIQTFVLFFAVQYLHASPMTSSGTECYHRGSISIDMTRTQEPLRKCRPKRITTLLGGLLGDS